MRCILLCCLLSLSFLSYTQPTTLSVEHLTVENGLPENYATDIVQDAKGYMWIGTQLGLARYDGYSVKVYKEELDKVKSGFYGVYSLFIDSHKRVWVGTGQQGLLKYDPVKDTFKTYPYITDKNDTLSNVRGILEDGSGNLWLSSIKAKKRTYVLYKFDEETSKFTGFGGDNKNGVPATQLSYSIVDKGGNVWASTNNGIYKFDPAANKFIGYLTSSNGAKPKTIKVIYEPPSESGILYMSVADSAGSHGLIRFNTKNNTFATFSHSNRDANSLLNDTVSSIKEDDAGRLWIGTAAGLSMFNRSATNFKNYPRKDSSAEKKRDPITIIQGDVAGFLWLSSMNGLSSFNPATGAFVSYPSDINREDGLSPTATLKIFRDSTGGIWLTSRLIGVQRINNAKSKFTVVRNIPDQPESYNSGRVYNIAEDSDHTFWMFTAKGLCNYNPVKNSFKNINLSKDPIDPNVVRPAMIQAKNGLIWANHINKGLVSYNPAAGKIKNYALVDNDTTSLSDSLVSGIYEDRSGTIWVGTRMGGLCRFNKEKENFTPYPFIINSNHSYSGKSLDDRTVLSMFEDSRGRFWVGTNQGGLNLMDRVKGTFTSYQNLQKGLGCINGITEDNKGRLWLSSYIAGISIFDPVTGNTKRFTEKNGLLCNASRAIAKDAEGNLWSSSERGLSFINTETLVIKNFTKAQGLPDNVFLNPLFSNSSGELMVGYKSGLVIFSASIAKPNNVVPITNIESVSFTTSTKDGERDSVIIVSGQPRISLKHDENRLTFHYVGLQYENAPLNTYKYKLEGYDKDWIEAGTLRSVTYTNISPGTYTLYVKSANSDGVWNEKAESIKVTIHWPWWRTWWAYLIYAALLVAALRAYIVFRSKALRRRNSILEQKVSHRTHQLREANEELKATQDEIVAQRDELARTVNTLQATQTQLIQSEKMASLGELTAGIAHEIQNPLNFVNNFSEVSTELVEELKGERSKVNGERDEAFEIVIMNDLSENLQKITYHGKRADAIVKGMLQHSRASTGRKEPTDINALADEYLRLAYHGLRAKDKDFNADFKTDFDESVGKIEVVSQDIGRVLLNLYNNAFYAVSERCKVEGVGYKPTVWVTTKAFKPTSGGLDISIMVKDNGVGIPQKVADKIFQPFFTTKPTGQGTGLGLSLSYDIIKAHGGELRVETKEVEGSEFIIQLPLIS